MLKNNHHIVYNPNVHKWTPQEKQVNCACCLLAEAMKYCQACPFYTPKVNTVLTMKGKV